MRKTTFSILSVVAALMATSCSKDSVSSMSPGNAIRVNPFVNAAAKATEVNSTNFSQFKLYGFAQTTVAANFEDTYTGSMSATWTPTLGKHYWPSSNTETMDFLAHSPADLSTAFLEKPTVSFALETMTTPGPLPSSVEISGVKPKVHAKDQVDFLISRNKDISQTAAASGVSLLFKHALTQVAIRAKCSNSNMIVKVKGVKLGNFQTNKNFSYPNNTITTAENPMGDNVWSSSSDLTSYMAGGTSSAYQTVNLSSSYQDITSAQSFMILPQSGLTAWTPNAPNGGTYIAVLCQIYQGTETADNLLFPSSIDKWGFAAVGIGNALPIGKKTTINLEFFGANGGGAGNIPPDKTDPSLPDDGNVDNNTGNEGDPVVGGPISFNVTVSGWSEGWSTPDTDGQVPMPN